METVNSSRGHVGFGGNIRTARLVGRRVRFLMDFEDASGPFTAHTNNTGSMLGLLRPGCEALLSVSDAPGRKYACTVEALRLRGCREDFWVGVNTSLPPRMLRAAWEAGLLPDCGMYTLFQAEPRFCGGRLDARLSGPGCELLVETKNVTLVEECVAQFPDAPTERGRKHLVELMRLVQAGTRAALFFAVQRPDAGCFGPADAVDPQYGELLRQAVAAGVEVWPFVVDVAEDGYRLGRRLKLAL
ncbi:MAG: DNA/RNA nuclease SfsA [Acidobacteriota bacterium]